MESKGTNLDKNISKKTVLLVEDEADIRLLYAEILMDAGYEVVQAKNGEEARDGVQNVDWDILLLDIILPQEDGLQLLRDFKDTSYTKKGPVIVLTNLKSNHVMNDADELGVYGYIVKSDITPDEILTQVSRALKG